MDKRFDIFDRSLSAFREYLNVHSRIVMPPVDRRCHGPQPPKEGTTAGNFPPKHVSRLSAALHAIHSTPHITPLSLLVLGSAILSAVTKRHGHRTCLQTKLTTGSKS